MIIPRSPSAIMAPDPLSPVTRLENEERWMERDIMRQQPSRGLEVGPKDINYQGAQPSETDLLMALAEMHKQGRFAQPEPQPTSNVIPMKRK